MHQRFPKCLTSSWWSRWFTNNVRPVRRPVAVKFDRRRIQPMIEPLDRHVMMVFTAAFNAATGVSVTGDDQDNRIAVSFVPAGRRGRRLADRAGPATTG